MTAFRGVSLARFTTTGALDYELLRRRQGQRRLQRPRPPRRGRRRSAPTAGPSSAACRSRVSASAPNGFRQDFFLARFTPGRLARHDRSARPRPRHDRLRRQIDILDEVLVLPDNKILAVGRQRASSTSALNLAIARYNANGTLDTSFSGDGKLTLDLGGRRGGRQAGPPQRTAT